MIELHMFPKSHFNEKARWGLDYKSVAHKRIPYLPGPHTGKIMKLSGQPQTPVVKFDDGSVVAGSTAILLELETRYPDPALLPADEAARAEAMAIVEKFDGDIAVKERRGFFVNLIDEPDYLCSMFAVGQPAMMRFVYRHMLPLVRGKMVRSMEIDGEASREEGLAVTRDAFDFIAEKTAATGYLVGNGFTIADLTAAAIMAPSVKVDHPDMRKPEPVPPRVQDWYDRFADHPGAAWVRGMYARHRPQPVLAAA